MRTKLAFRNAAASLLLQLTLALSGILLPRFFIAVYGSPVNGLVSSITQFISYMTLVEAGIGAAGTVSLYQPLARGDLPSVSRIVSAARRFYLRSGALFAALAVLLTVFYPYAVRSEIQNVSFIRMMVLVLCVNGIVDYFFLGKYRVLLLADQRGYVISVIQIVGTVVMTAASIVLIQLNCSALLVKAVAAVIYLLRSLAVALYVRRHYPKVDFRAEADNAAFAQRWSALLHQVVGMVVNNTDIVLLTLLLARNALAEVSVYTVYNMVAYALSGLLQSISNGLGSGFGQVIASGERDTLRRSFSSYEYVFFLIIFAAYGSMAVLLYPFVGLYSADFTDGVVYLRWPLVALFTAGGLLQSLRLPGLTLITAAGHFRQTRVRAVVEAVINLGVSLALIRPLGIVGVLLGTCASYLYRTTDVILYSARHFVPGSLGRTLFRLLRNGLFTGAAVALGVRLQERLITGWGSWLLWAVVWSLALGAGLCLCNLLCEGAEFRALVRRFRELINRRRSA